MKKLRVAMKFTDDDIVKVLELANFRITKTELGLLPACSLIAGPISEKMKYIATLINKANQRTTSV